MTAEPTKRDPRRDPRPGEPSNEQLLEWIGWEHSHTIDGRHQAASCHLPHVCRALLAARETIDERNSQLTALRTMALSLTEEIAVNKALYNRNISISDALRQERDAARAGEVRLREALEKIEPLVIACINADTDLATAPSRGTAFGTELPPHKSYFSKSQEAWKAFRAVIEEALSFTADSAKWLEERLAEVRKIEGQQSYEALTNAIETARKEPQHIGLIGKPGDAFGDALRALVSEAEQRGYERGKVEENEAYEREVFRQIAKAKAEGEIAGLQQAADFAIDCNLDTFAHSLRLKAGNREHKRQLAARRGKEEEERKDGE